MYFSWYEQTISKKFKNSKAEVDFILSKKDWHILSLHDSKLSNKSAKKIFNALPFMPIRMLNLENNQLSAEILAPHIVKFLQQTKTLKEFYINFKDSWNKAALGKIGEAIKENLHLTTLRPNTYLYKICLPFLKRNQLRNEQHYTHGAVAGMFGGAPKPLPHELGIHIGQFLDRQNGAHVARVNKRAAATAKAEQSRADALLLQKINETDPEVKAYKKYR